MKLLIIETSVERQSEYTRRIDNFDKRDLEMFDLTVSLTTIEESMMHVAGKDVAILGAGLEGRAVSLARELLAINPELRIIMFADDSRYSAHSFRSAYSAGVQKVLPNNASDLDLLQELVAILDSQKKKGIVREGRVVCLIQAKGGTGVTTIAAALAEICNQSGLSSLLWDFDIDTADLSRGLGYAPRQAHMLSQWLENKAEVSRESLKLASVELFDNFFLLPPPVETIAESFDLVCHTHGIAVANRVIDCAESIFDTVIVDTAGRLGPATGSLVSVADKVIVVIDDTVMGLTGLDMFIRFLQPLISDPKSLIFLVNGASRHSLAVREVQETLYELHGIGEEAWILPPVPVDSNGTSWAGSGNTLYSLGSKETKSALQQIARLLGLLD